MPKYRITTPEQVSFHYTIAGLATRCLAWLVDQFLIWIGYAILAFLFLQVGGYIGIALFLLGMFVLDFSYFVFFELYWAGQSPGKRMMGIRVISARGNRLQFADVLVRNLMRPIDVLPFGMILGGTVALIDRWHRRLGDLVSDTLVVRDVRNALPQSLANAKARVNSFQTDPALRNRVMSRITRDERDLIMDLTVRRDQMEAEVRERLFDRAATHFRRRLALPAEAGHLSDEQTIVNLALLIQDTKFTA